MEKPREMGIIGLGLMGGSLALALKKYLPGIRIAGQDRQREHLNYALAEGMVDEEINGKNLNRLEVVFIAVPVRSVIPIISGLLPDLKTDAVITDLASTKGCLSREIEDKFPELNYIGGHPLAGREVSGPRGAQADLFQDKKYILTTAGSGEPGVSQQTERAYKVLAGIIEGIGARVIKLTPEGHDRLLAFTSHLPQLLATLLCEQLCRLDDDQKTAYQELIGQGFLDMTRIAASDPEMWLDIFMTNREELSAHSRGLQQGIERVGRLLRAGDEEELKELFIRGREKRLQLETGGKNTGG